MSTYWAYTLAQAYDPSASPADSVDQTLALRAPKDLALDPATGFLAIPIAFVTGAAAIMQRVTIRLRTFLGEWFLDQRIGTPWRERIFIKGIDSRDVKQILSQVIESTPGVKAVTNFDATIDGRSRVLTVQTMTILLDDGSTISAKSKQPFIVS